MSFEIISDVVEIQRKLFLTIK